MAEVTVTAGVMTPSAMRVEAPMAAIMYSQRWRRRRTREKRARMPPSPLLSARRAMRTYLTVVWSVRVQIMHDIAPIT